MHRGAGIDRAFDVGDRLVAETPDDVRQGIDVRSCSSGQRLGRLTFSIAARSMYSTVAGVVFRLVHLAHLSSRASGTSRSPDEPRRGRRERPPSPRSAG